VEPTPVKAVSSILYVKLYTVYTVLGYFNLLSNINTVN
jgi:hypothetical protein